MNYITSLVSFQTASGISGGTMIVRARWIPAALLGLVLILLTSSGTVAARTDDCKEATKLHQQGKLGQAMSEVSTGLQTQPKDVPGRFLKGLIVHRAIRLSLYKESNENS